MLWQVMLDPNGQMVDFLLCAQLSGPRTRTRMEHTVFTDPKKVRDAPAMLLLHMGRRRRSKLASNRTHLCQRLSVDRHMLFDACSINSSQPLTWPPPLSLHTHARTELSRHFSNKCTQEGNKNTSRRASQDFLDDGKCIASPHKKRSRLLQSKDAARVRDFILKHSPHLIVVGTAGPEAVQLITDIKQVSDDILENNARFLTTSDTGALAAPNLQERPGLLPGTTGLTQCHPHDVHDRLVTGSCSLTRSHECQISKAKASMHCCTSMV